MTILGFHHVSREVWLVDMPQQEQEQQAAQQRRRRRRLRGQPTRPQPAGAGATQQAQEPPEQVIVCDDSGEDPSCHNSACRLGMCTSVADHLVYLGVHMYGGGEC
jgi:hypothetical protein